jgi:methylthioribose-1-phosphate isomerase
LCDEVASLRQERDVAEAHQREKVAELEREIERLLEDAEARQALGARGVKAVMRRKGVVARCAASLSERIRSDR